MNSAQQQHNKVHLISPIKKANQTVPKQDMKIIEVETLFIGGGPATLGILANAYQTSRLEELVKGQSNQDQGVPGIDQANVLGQSGPPVKYS